MSGMSWKCIGKDWNGGIQCEVAETLYLSAAHGRGDRVYSRTCTFEPSFPL